MRVPYTLMRTAPWMLALGAAVACSQEAQPAGQIVLYVTTDAVLPSADGTFDESAPAPLFDRLRIEIFPPGEATPCAGCSREFGVDAPTFDEARASIGVVPRTGTSGYRARVRLFRTARAPAAEPRPSATLESVVALPPAPAEGKLEITVHLETDHLAAPQGSLDTPIAATAGGPRRGLAGTWGAAKRVLCKGAPREDEACVPGGAFWMGDVALDDLGEYGGRSERLVVLRPFFLDLTEVTVAKFRASGLARSLSPGAPSDNPKERGTGIEGCVYTSKPDTTDALPVNCVSWSLARAYCESVGKALPTEAQLEYVIGALWSRRFPWGEDLPACGDAVFDRRSEGACKSLPHQPAIPGFTARDRVTLGDRTVVDLMGNVCEWTADQWNRDDEPCWGAGVLHDPACAAPSALDPPSRTYRGGSYDWDALLLSSARRGRLANEEQAVSAPLGFRCARPAD